MGITEGWGPGDIEPIENCFCPVCTLARQPKPPALKPLPERFEAIVEASSGCFGNGGNEVHLETLGADGKRSEWARDIRPLARVKVELRDKALMPAGIAVRKFRLTLEPIAE